MTSQAQAAICEASAGQSYGHQARLKPRCQAWLRQLKPSRLAKFRASSHNYQIHSSGYASSQGYQGRHSTYGFRAARDTRLGLLSGMGWATGIEWGIGLRWKSGIEWSTGLAWESGMEWGSGLMCRCHESVKGVTQNAPNEL
jgi:hypothetical protein